MAVTRDVFDEVAAGLPWVAALILAMAPWSETKSPSRVVRALCWPVSVVTSFCINCMGREAALTAFARTVWKLLEKVLEPLKAGTVIELVLEDI